MVIATHPWLVLRALRIAVGTVMGVAIVGAALPRPSWSQSSGAQTYRLISMGSAGASSINDSGVVTGTRQVSGVFTAYRYSAGVFTNLKPPKGFLGDAYGYKTNLAGQTVGFGNTNGGSARGVLWQPGSTSGIEIKPVERDIHAMAFSINARGDLVGISQDRNSTKHATLWRATAPNGGLFSPVRLAVNAGSSADDINDYGQIILTGQANGLWSPSVPNGTTGTVLPLGFTPRKISVTGHVCGYVPSTGGVASVAAVWIPDSPNSPVGNSTVIGALVPGYSSYAHLVNGNGDVVGWSSLVPGAPNIYQRTAFLYSGGILKDMNSAADFLYVDAAGNGLSGWNLSEAAAINNAGQIVAYAFDPSGVRQAVLLTPAP